MLEYPTWLGRWPAAIGILGFAFVELAYRNRDDPSQLAIMALVYAVVMLAGMAWFGIETWSERADPFGVYFGLFARLSPFTRRDGVLQRRPPLSGAPAARASWPGTIALLAVAIGSTTFDGFSNGAVWRSLAPHIESLFSHLGAGPQAPAPVGVADRPGRLRAARRRLLPARHPRAWSRVGEGHTATELARRFAHTLIPIAFAYALAHYFSLLVFQGQGAIHLISDPLGHGLGPVRHRGGGDQLRRDLLEGHLVRAGRRAGGGPRGGPDPRPRPRGGDVPAGRRTRASPSTGCWS